MVDRLKELKKGAVELDPDDVAIDIDGGGMELHLSVFYLIFMFYIHAFTCLSLSLHFMIISIIIHYLYVLFLYWVCRKA